tara:strand:+ start:2606 stop:2866 length:261 start_codon:yes stop_codon:yes gene_type:complete
MKFRALESEQWIDIINAPDLNLIEALEENAQRERDQMDRKIEADLAKLYTFYGDDFDEYAYFNDGYYKWCERQGRDPYRLSDKGAN